MADSRALKTLSRPKKKLGTKEIQRAEVCRFYGWRHKDIMEMPIDIYLDYLRAMPVLNSRECLRDLFVIETPKLKEHARSSRYRELKEEAYPREKNVISFDEFAQRVNR